MLAYWIWVLSYILNFLIPAYFSSSGILLVDEIEAGIHSKALKNFIGKLLNVCTSNNVQIFLTTHSLETIDIILDDCPDRLNDISIYHIRNQGNQTLTKNYNEEKLLTLRNEIGFDVR